MKTVYLRKKNLAETLRCKLKTTNLFYRGRMTIILQYSHQTDKIAISFSNQFESYASFQ